MNVLIITRSEDNECVPRVAAAVEARGGRAIRFDTDRFPLDVDLVMRYGPDGERLVLRNASGDTDLSDLGAVWYRRTHFGGCLPESMDKQIRRASAGECRATILGMLSGIRAFYLDPLPVLRMAGVKPLQLQVAQRLGLRTPRTLITDNPEEVRRFVDECDGGVVTKMLSSFAIFDEEGREHVVFTTPIAHEHLGDLDGLKYCPMTFQEKLPKKMELRVTIVGDRVFAAAIDSQRLDRSRVDWRREGQALLTEWTEWTLPGAVQRQLLQMMDHFRLNYGAIDIVVTPDDEYVFLEVNPAGEFFWLELYPGFPISDAIADVLMGRAFRREHSLPTMCPEALTPAGRRPVAP